MIKKIFYVIIAIAVGIISVLFPYLNKLTSWKVFNDLILFLLVMIRMISFYLFLFAVIAILISLFLIIANKTKKISFILFPLLIFSAINFFGEDFIPDRIIVSSRDKEIQNCETIITSIEEFKKQNGYYPDILNLIIPEYLDKMIIPVTNGVDEYVYVKTKDSYNLYFNRYKLSNNKKEIIVYDPLEKYKGVTLKFSMFRTKYRHWIYTIED